MILLCPKCGTKSTLAEFHGSVQCPVCKTRLVDGDQ